MLRSTTPATQMATATTGPLRAERATGASPIPEEPRLSQQNNVGYHQIPCLSHKGMIDVTKCHACHANGSGDHRSTAGRARHRSQSNSRRAMPVTTKRYWISPNALPTTQRDDRCYEVPCLPRKWQRRSPVHCGPSAPPEPVQFQKSHACHNKTILDVTKCHAYHTKG